MGYRKEEFNIEVGTGIIKIFERVDIENFRIFSEFIDKSFQSFIDHQKVMEDVLHVKKCVVKITWTDDEIVIEDNAFGMDREAFSRALRLNAPAAKYSKGSLSKYGMGLKYAASNLGSLYIIESSAYGSPLQFRGTVDVNDWIQNNPKTMPVEIIDDFDVNKHFTSITIKNLFHKFNQSQMQAAIKKLGTIYSYFIDKKLLSISINDVNVTYDEPELLKNENGGDFMELINASFIFEGKVYKYVGWIGVLAKGSTYDAGLTLIQNNRGIELNYRPQFIFGGGNRYSYQRIVGQINFEGDNWEVRVNKDGLAWKATGLQETFLEHLKNLDAVKKIIKVAEEYRSRENPKRKVSCDANNCSYDGLKPEYLIGEKVCFTVIPRENFRIKSVKVGTTELTADNEEGNKFSFVIEAKMSNTIKIKILCTDAPSKETVKPVPPVGGGGSGAVTVTLPPESIKKPLTKKDKIESTFSNMSSTKVSGEAVKENPNLKPDGVVVKYENTMYSFEIEEITDSNEKEWLTLKQAHSPYENSYLLRINYGAGFLKGVYFTDDGKLALLNLALSMALARITSVSSGLSLDQSKIFFDKLDDIFAKTGK